jgi:GDPmannose 4,6-dehydratase
MSGVLPRRALITGVSGQDGSYIAELLLGRGYVVHGVLPQHDGPASLHPDVAAVLGRLTLHYADVEDLDTMRSIVASVAPHECYHLAGRSAVRYDSESERLTLDANLTGTLNLLSAIRDGAAHCKLCFAASSEIFGNAEFAPQTETSRHNPRSIYGISKLGAFELMRYYRSHHGLFTASAIFYNHESPRRGPNFVTRKISLGLARIMAGRASEIVLGNIDARRDWGHARDYVEAMWRMLQRDEPSDYVIGTGELHTVRDFIERAFSRAGVDWKRYITVDDSLVRNEWRIPLVADARKAWAELHWRPSTSFTALVDEMVDSDRRLVSSGTAELD